MGLPGAVTQTWSSTAMTPTKGGTQPLSFSKPTPVPPRHCPAGWGDPPGAPAAGSKPAGAAGCHLTGSAAKPASCPPTGLQNKPRQQWQGRSKNSLCSQKRDQQEGRDEPFLETWILHFCMPGRWVNPGLTQIPGPHPLLQMKDTKGLHLPKHSHLRSRFQWDCTHGVPLFYH